MLGSYRGRVQELAAVGFPQTPSEPEQTMMLVGRLGTTEAGVEIQ